MSEEPPLGGHHEPGNSTELESEHASHHREESWRNAPIPNRLTAEFHIGRLLNWFGWSAQQVLFMCSSDGRKTMDEILCRLIAIAYKFMTKPPEHIQDFINEMRDDALGSLCCEAAVDEVSECFEETSEVRRQDVVNNRVYPLIDKLQQKLVNFSEPEEWTLELGRVLDQGVRRPDLFRFVQGNRSILSGYYTRKRRGSRPDWGESGLAISSIKVGELPPDTAWPHMLNELLAKVGVPTATYETSLTAWQFKEQKDQLSTMPQLLEVLDRGIRKYLESCESESTKATNAPHSAPLTDSGNEAPGNRDRAAPNVSACTAPGSNGLAGGTQVTRREFDHADDFRSVRWYGREYSFTQTQAPVVALLWKHFQKGTPDVGDETLLDAIDPNNPPDRLRDVFRGCDAWNTMIISGNTKGTRRLTKPL